MMTAILIIMGIGIVVLFFTLRQVIHERNTERFLIGADYWKRIAEQEKDNER